MTLDITDPKYNVTVSLDDGVNCAITRGGWAQAGPNPLPGGLWGDVDETVLVSLLGQDDTIYGLLSFIARRAEEVQSPLHPDYLNPGVKPFVYAQTPDEGNGRWALVKSLSVEKLDPSHYRANGRTTLRIKFTREGLWRGLEPGSTPLELIAYTSSKTPLEPVQFTNDSIGTTGLLGDAPPLLITKLRTYPSTSARLAIVPEAYPDSVTTPYDPFLWAASLADTPTLTDISTLTGVFAGADILPGGKCYLVTDGNYARWQIDLRNYFGQYTAYAVTLSNTGAELKFAQQFGGGGIDFGDWIPVYNSNNKWIIHKLGTFRIPFAGESIRGTPPASTYYVGMYISDDAVGKLYLGGMFLRREPDIPPQVVASYATSVAPITVVDGELEQVYWTDVSGNVVVFDPPEIPSGPFQSVTPGPGVRNYLHLIPVPAPGYDYGGAPVMAETAVWGLGISYIPRWQHINQEGL